MDQHFYFILFLQILVLLLLTSGRDPGIIPRNAHPPEPEGFDGNVEVGASQTPQLRLPRIKEVEVNGITIKIKYCDTCMLYRPARCSHCSICNNCVERFDHHCPWVGQCIGRVSHILWLGFLLLLLLCMFASTKTCFMFTMSYCFLFLFIFFIFLFWGWGVGWDSVMLHHCSWVDCFISLRETWAFL